MSCPLMRGIHGDAAAQLFVEGGTGRAKTRMVSAALITSVPKGIGQKGLQLPREQAHDAGFERQ